MEIKPNNIYLGDCYELIKFMDGKSVDLVITDPPYEFVMGGKGHSEIGNRKAKNKGEVYTVRNQFNENGGWEKHFECCKGKVVAKFTLNKVEEIEEIVCNCGNDMYYGTSTLLKRKFEKLSCLSHKETRDYLNNKTGYAWHISNLEIFDKPKELSEFGNWKKDKHIKNILDSETFCLLTKAPQSWQFIEIGE